MRSWLKTNKDSDLPGVEFLANTVEKVIADRVVTRDELKELYLAIEKVLPSDVRKEATQRRRAVEAARQKSDRAKREAEKQREREKREHEREKRTAAKQEKELADRMRMFRKLQNRELQQAKSNRGLVVRLKVIAGEDSCDYCKAQNGRVYPVEQCSENWLPPWGQCTHELGCRCCVEMQLDDALYEGVPPANYGQGYEASRARAAREAAEARQAGILPIHEEPLYLRLKAYSIAWGKPV